MSKGKTQTHASNKTGKIIEAIEAEAQYKIRVIEDVLSNKLGTLKEDNDKKIAEGTAIIKKETERNKALLENRIIAEAELSSRRKLEDAKESIVRKSFEQARNLLEKEVEVSSPAYKAFMKKKGEDAKRMIPAGGNVEVISGDKAASILSALGFKVSETLPLSAIGGALFHAPDGRMHLDCTLVHTIQRDMVELRTMASRSLFGNNTGAPVKEDTVAATPSPVTPTPKEPTTKENELEEK